MAWKSWAAGCVWPLCFGEFLFHQSLLRSPGPDWCRILYPKVASLSISLFSFRVFIGSSALQDRKKKKQIKPNPRTVDCLAFQTPPVTPSEYTTSHTRQLTKD
jgi:hypothetical protein